MAANLVRLMGVQKGDPDIMNAHRIAKAKVKMLTMRTSRMARNSTRHPGRDRRMSVIVNAPYANDDAVFGSAAFIFENADGDEQEEQPEVALLKNHLKRRARSPAGWQVRGRGRFG